MATERKRLIAARDVVKMAEAWAELVLCNLERMHRAAGFATGLALRRQFLASKKLDSETMEACTGRIHSMVLRMEYPGIICGTRAALLTRPPSIVLDVPASLALRFRTQWRMVNPEKRMQSTAADFDVKRSENVA
ncbi:hypothetical protein B0H13DRAFT_2369205 [Mycena leptocephala]|nr:hypothetical protein B0H13DRAFT_2369205 [Mycena leptocephala]